MRAESYFQFQLIMIKTFGFSFFHFLIVEVDFDNYNKAAEFCTNCINFWIAKDVLVSQLSL